MAAQAFFVDNGGSATASSGAGMQVFEIETSDPNPSNEEQEPFFFDYPAANDNSNNNYEGIGGRIITSYRLLTGGVGGSRDYIVGGDNDVDDFGEGISRRRRSSIVFQELIGSGLFRTALMVLVVVAVLIHLSLDKREGDMWESTAATTEPTAANGADTSGLMKYKNKETANKFDGASPHAFSFGGKNNMGHNCEDPSTDNYNPGQEEGEEQEDQDNLLLEKEIDLEIIERMGDWDLTSINIANEQGHYLHDPLLSPFASKLYDASQDELDNRQKQFNNKMEATITEFGVWNGPILGKQADKALFENYEYRDTPLEEIPPNAWQKDEQYIRSFLNEAQALVEATKEAIMMEYGHPNPIGAEKEMFDVIVGDYEVLNGSAFHPLSLEKLNGIAYLSQRAWNALVRKLLHAIITEDWFYVVVAGGEETYAANNFAQSQVMQFNYIMEPILHKLGVKLISRNMGMKSSPLLSALGGADIYGETDILWHIQDIAAEEKPGEFDLLQRQAILSGERIPIILSPDSDELVISSKEMAWVGNLQPGADFCEFTTTHGVPDTPACQNVRCDNDVEAVGQCQVYKSVCWETRKDCTPATNQNDDVGNQDQGYPGYRQHQLEGRKMTLLLLHATSAALNLWQEKLDQESLPLAPQYWHVRKTYRDVRKAVMKLDRTPGEAAGFSASCEFLLKDLDPRICHITMHAFTEWTPRALRVPSIKESGACRGPDILPLEWQIPESEIDVHMVAIAANVTYVEFDVDFGAEFDADTHDGASDNNNNNNNDFGRKLQAESHQMPVWKRSATKIAELKFLSDIVTGSGWALVDVPVGFCDGSAQSRCNRTRDNNCLLANHNHYRGSLAGTPKDGWLVLNLDKIRHGIILARMEVDSSSAPDDLILDFAINGNVTSMPKSMLESFSHTIVKELKVYPLLLEKSTGLIGHSSDMGYEVGFRLRSELNPDFTVRLSHVYFA